MIPIRISIYHHFQSHVCIVSCTEVNIKFLRQPSSSTERAVLKIINRTEQNSPFSHNTGTFVPRTFENVQKNGQLKSEVVIMAQKPMRWKSLWASFGPSLGKWRSSHEGTGTLYWKLRGKPKQISTKDDTAERKECDNIEICGSLMFVFGMVLAGKICVHALGTHTSTFVLAAISRFFCLFPQTWQHCSGYRGPLQVTLVASGRGPERSFQW